MVWVQGGGHPAAEAPSPPSPVFGAFDDRNLARSGALSYGPPALGGGQAPPKDTLRTLAPGRLPTAAHPTPDAVGGGAKGTGDWSQAIYIANAVLRERVYADARDLNMDFTNRALTMGIVAIATAAQGVETLNSDSIDDPLTRTRAMELLCEASDVVNECLEGQDGVQRWISAVARDGAGITMRKNLKIVREMILSIQQVARDYFRQNPLD